MQRGAIPWRIVEVPILVELDVPVCGDQVMSRWDLKNSVKKRADLVTAEFRRLRN